MRHRLLYTISLSLFVLLGNSRLIAQVSDTVRVDSLSTVAPDSTGGKHKEKYAGLRQLRLGTDLSRVFFNIADPDHQAYDFQIDYNTNAKNYWTAEAGFGKGTVDYPYLKYDARAFYTKIGLDRSLLDIKGKHDFDIAFMGFRYAAAYGNLSDAWYALESPFGGITEGNVAGKSFFVHWGEITLGMKLEVWKKIFLGWTGRGKFLFNAGSFKDIYPSFIAGYGSADKTTSFDINLYLSYSLFRTESTQ